MFRVIRPTTENGIYNWRRGVNCEHVLTPLLPLGVTWPDVFGMLDTQNPIAERTTVYQLLDFLQAWQRRQGGEVLGQMLGLWHEPIFTFPRHEARDYFRLFYYVFRQ
ncbi:MAG: hypothetical protein AMJ69_05545 [Gammaproteobacteria bacterium SG8_47]|nr:MAG: hypothetical protein AMJ69_05545 [Gammaproteobacteria bacterium SG8_47]